MFAEASWSVYFSLTLLLRISHCMPSRKWLQTLPSKLKAFKKIPFLLEATSWTPRRGGRSAQGSPRPQAETLTFAFSLVPETLCSTASTMRPLQPVAKHRAFDTSMLHDFHRCNATSQQSLNPRAQTLSPCSCKPNVRRVIVDLGSTEVADYAPGHNARGPDLWEGRSQV